MLYLHIKKHMCVTVCNNNEETCHEFIREQGKYRRGLGGSRGKGGNDVIILLKKKNNKN